MVFILQLTDIFKIIIIKKIKGRKVGRRGYPRCRLQALLVISLDHESEAAPHPRPNSTPTTPTRIDEATKHVGFDFALFHQTLSTPNSQALSPARSSSLPLYPSPPPPPFVHSKKYIFLVMENHHVFLCASRSQWLVNQRSAGYVMQLGGILLARYRI